MRANVVAAVVVAISVAGGAVAATSFVGADGTIAACVDRKGKGKGDLRVVKPGGECRRGEQAIAWAQAGAAGAMGPSGSAGPTGPRGERGARGPGGADGQDGTDGQDGVDGPAGPTGAQGATGPKGATGAAGPAARRVNITITGEDFVGLQYFGGPFNQDYELQLGCQPNGDFPHGLLSIAELTTTTHPVRLSGLRGTNDGSVSPRMASATLGTSGPQTLSHMNTAPANGFMREQGNILIYGPGTTYSFDYDLMLDRRDGLDCYLRGTIVQAP